MSGKQQEYVDEMKVRFEGGPFDGEVVHLLVEVHDPYHYTVAPMQYDRTKLAQHNAAMVKKVLAE